MASFFVFVFVLVFLCVLFIVIFNAERLQVSGNNFPPISSFQGNGIFHPANTQEHFFLGSFLLHFVVQTQPRNAHKMFLKFKTACQRLILLPLKNLNLKKCELEGVLKKREAAATVLPWILPSSHTIFCLSTSTSLLLKLLREVDKANTRQSPKSKILFKRIFLSKLSDGGDKSGKRKD